MTTVGKLRDARTALWHLRTGGFGQLREWARRRGAGALNGRIDRSAMSPSARYTDVTSLPLTRTFPEIRAGVILDEFSSTAFDPEWISVPMTRRGWRTQIGEIDLLFVESAWNGNRGE